MKRQDPEPHLTVRFRPIVVGYQLEFIDGDRTTWVELYQEAGSKIPFFTRGASVIPAIQRLKEAAGRLKMDIDRDSNGVVRLTRRKRR